MRTHGSILLTALLFAGTSACDFDRDVVAPGYYGVTAQAGSNATPTSCAGSGNATPTSSAASSNTSMGAPAAGASGTGPQSMGTAGSADNTVKAGMSGGAVGGAGGTPSSGGPMAGATAPASDCDLSGRWLCTLHEVTDGLGQLQYSHRYVYYEIEQSGDAFSVKKGMQCLNDTVADGTFAVMGDFSKAWPSLMRKVVYAGRQGTSVKTADGCKVDIAKMYTLYGATLPYYLDPSVPLPNADQKATDTTPGWEDWDGDGHPGITGVMTGTVTGEVYVAPREWTTLSGTVPNVSSAFELSVMWDLEPNVMAYDGSPFLTSEAVRAADATLHFAQFVRLAPDQATGDDDAICQSLRQLAPMLTPKAAGM